MAVLLLPVRLLVKAWEPKAVLLKPPEGPVPVLASAAVPPAVLPLASLAVGLGGPAQLAPAPTVTRTLAITIILW